MSPNALTTSSATVSGRPAGRRVDAAAERGRAVAAQGRGERAGVVLVLRVGAGEGRPLHALGRLGDRHRLVALDLDQAVVELADRVAAGRAPARACPSPATAAAGTGRRSRGRRSRCCGSCDSWKAVAIAIVVARGGSPRRWAIAAISVVQRACSMSICARVSPTSATQYSLRTGSRSRTTVATSTPARTSPARKTQRNLMATASVGVQVGVELDAAALAARSGLERAGLGVGEEQDAVLARQLRPP